MKKLILLLSCSLFGHSTFAQNSWFILYKDSLALLEDAKIISGKFINDIKNLKPNIEFNVETIHNTTLFLIYYDDIKKTANLPLWSEVISEQQEFFYEVAGSETNGKKAFGLFFNGFYLPHELGHAFQAITEGTIEGSYENEYFANTVAMLWWRKQGKEKDLKECYESAKLIWEKLPNPVPVDITIQDFFKANYNKAGEDPYVYGYMQFKQFILIYEDKKLPDFDTFIKNYIDKK